MTLAQEGVQLQVTNDHDIFQSEEKLDRDVDEMLKLL